MATSKTSKKSVKPAAKKVATKSAAKKAPAKKKVSTATKSTAKKATGASSKSVKKSGAAKKSKSAGMKTVSLIDSRGEVAFHKIQQEAYFIAERDGFHRDPVAYWFEAEVNLGMRKA